MTLREAAGVLAPCFARHRRSMLLGLGALIAKSLAGAAWPLLLKQGVDALSSGKFTVILLAWIASAICPFEAFSSLVTAKPSDANVAAIACASCTGLNTMGDGLNT